MPLGEPFQPTEPEWLVKAQAGIKTKTEIPRIIPPLPTGDTKDLKVWKAYWQQHDAAIARAATLAAEQTSNILTVLKKRYKTELAILDYVEMIECEVISLQQQEQLK